MSNAFRIYVRHSNIEAVEEELPKTRRLLRSRTSYGITSLLKETLEGGCAWWLESKLVGGHSAGGLNGFEIMEERDLPYRSAREHKDMTRSGLRIFLSQYDVPKDEHVGTDESALRNGRKMDGMSQLYVGKRLQASITLPYRMMRQTLIGEWYTRIEVSRRQKKRSYHRTLHGHVR